MERKKMSIVGLQYFLISNTIVPITIPINMLVERVEIKKNDPPWNMKR